MILNQFFIGGKYHEIYRAEMSFSFSHVFHHVFLIIITCISFDSVQICRYFIYSDVTHHAANEDWPRVCEAFLLLFCINFDRQVVKQPRSQGSLLPALRRAGRRVPWERGCS